MYKDIIVISLSVAAIVVTALLRSDVEGKAISSTVSYKEAETVVQLIDLAYPNSKSISVTEDNKLSTQKTGKDTPTVTDLSADKLESISFNTFKEKKSQEYLGAIYIPSVKIGDSIYKDSGDDFYLTHNYKKNKNDPGELYLDKRSAENLTSTGALVNGHSMSNGTKFGDLKNLVKQDDQPVLYLWDEGTQKSYKYRINSVNLIDNKNSGIIMDFDSNDARYLYYSYLYKDAIKKWEVPDSSKPVILLNTCSYIIDQGHYLVIATLEGEVNNVFGSNN
jgi:sortase B